MISLLMPVLAVTIFTSSTVKSISLPTIQAISESTASASSSFVFTKVLPEDNFVAHMVEEGETLKMIAQIHYGDQEYWTNIWNDNFKISDPDKLPEGLFIKLNASKPEKVADLKDELKISLSKLYPQPIYYALVNNYPQSNYEEVYKAAGEKFGIPWQILYGIHYTETGLRNGEIYNSQGSGAQGPMQFMPGTFRAYGVSAHGGVPDINDAQDAIYSAANFLAKHGSLEAGLRYYGGNIPGTLAAAKSKGYTD